MQWNGGTFVRWHRPRPLAWTSVVALVAVLVLAGCGGKAPSGGGGSSEGGELTLWTHNAGNKAELASITAIVNDYNASQTKYKVAIQAFPQDSYNQSVVAAIPQLAMVA